MLRRGGFGVQVAGDFEFRIILHQNLNGRVGRAEALPLTKPDVRISRIRLS